MRTRKERAALIKAAADKAKSRKDAIYSPGVVAHEAGHAFMHRHPEDAKKGRTKMDIMGAAETAGQLLPVAVAAAKLIGKRELRPQDLYYSAAVGFAPRLIDEYGSSIKGYSQVKDSKAFKKLKDEELKQERNRLISAGTTYGLAPVGMVGAGLAQSSKGAKVGLPLMAGATLGSVGALAHTTMAKGPTITAQEAKALAKEIAPGVEVYATKEPFAGGSAYLPPVKNRLMRALVSEQMKPYVGNKDREKLVREGGLLIAPMNEGTLAKALLGESAANRDMEDKFKRVK